MDSIINKLPEEIHKWVSSLKDYEIISIFTTAYTDRLNRVSTIQEKNTNIKQSAIIGAEGEYEIESILREKYIIDNTTKKGKCGDLVIIENGNRVMIEVKKYSKTIPIIEIDKFFRDINSNTSIKGAIMISLTSRIVGKRLIEYNNKNTNGNNIPVVFISLVDTPLDISKVCIYSILEVLFAEINSNNRYIDISDNITNAIYDIMSNLDHISQARLIVNETQSIMNRQFNKLIQSILIAEVNIKNSIERVKSNVECSEMNKSSIENAIDNLHNKVDTNKRNLLIKLLEHRKVLASKDTILTEDKKVKVKVNKTNITVSFDIELNETIKINGKWSYSNKKLTIDLTENTLYDIIQFIE